MGWERGNRYYTRSRKVDGRVVREYIGAGEKGEQAAADDVAEKERRDAQRHASAEERFRAEALAAEVDATNKLVMALARLLLVAQGYRRHHRGEWRKQRGSKQPDRPTRDCGD